MNMKYVLGSLALVVMFTGAADAQTATTTATSTATAPALAINLNATPSIRSGAQDAVLALITLSARQSSTPIQISSVPLDVSFANGAFEGVISDCRARNLTVLTIPLNSANVGMVSGANTITLDSAMTIAAGATETLALTCDVSSGTPTGSSVSIGLTPSRLAATAVGSTQSVGVSVGLTASGQPGATSGAVLFSASTAGGTIPGVPNTGADVTETLALLALMGLVAVVGVILARRLMMK